MDRADVCSGVGVSVGMRSRRVTTSAASSGAFTLIEVLVATAVLTVLAGLIVVRMSGGFEREVEIRIDATEGLLNTLAHRQTLGHYSLALVCEGTDLARDGRTLRLDLLMPDQQAEGRATWSPDLLVEPVQFDADIVLESVRIDGQEMEPPFRVEIPLDVQRPRIELTVTWTADARRPEAKQALILLLPQSTQAMRAYSDGRSGGWGERLQPVDLDEAGEGERPW